MDELILPARMEELLESSSSFQVCDTNSMAEFTENETFEMIEKLGEIVQNDFSEISQGSIDSIYNMLTDFNGMADENKNGFVTAMVDMCTAALRTCAVAEQSEREIPQSCKDTLRICFYFFQQMLFRVEASVGEALVGAEKPTKSSKSKRSRAANNDSFLWAEYRPICMELLQQVTAMNPDCLWRMGMIPESFMSSCWKYPLVVLEKAAEGGATGANAGLVGISGNGASETALRAKAVQVVHTAIAVMAAKGGRSGSGSEQLFVPMVTAFIDSICHYEAMANHIAKLLARLPAGNLLTAALMREIGTLNMADLNRSNSSSVKHVGMLLTALSSFIPEQMSLFMPMIMQQLNSEVYQIRSALLQSMGLTCQYICRMIVQATDSSRASVQVLAREEAEKKAQRRAARAAKAAEEDTDSSSEEEEEEEGADAPSAIDSLGAAMQSLALKKKRDVEAEEEEEEEGSGRSRTNIDGLVRVRDKMLDLLVERVHDTSFFTRAVVLKVWISLVESGSIPVQRVASVAQIALDRLMDKTALVRRSAIALFAALTEHNPFAGELDLAMFTQRGNELQGLIQARIALLLRDRDEAMAAEAQKTTAVMALSPVKPRKPAKAELATICEDGEEEDSADEKEAEEEEDLLLKTQRQILQDEATAQLFETDEQLKSYQLQLSGYIRYAVEFIAVLQTALPVVAQMFLSKTQGDVIASLRFVARAVKFNLGGSAKCLRESFGLIWHSEEPIRNECMSTFAAVYLTSGSNSSIDEDEDGAAGSYGGDSAALSPEEVADNLVALYAACSGNTSETTSLEKIVGDLSNRGDISGAVVKALWAVAERAEGPCSGCAFFIIAMVAKCKPAVISVEGVGMLVSIGLIGGCARRCNVTLRGAMQCLLAAPAFVGMPSTTISDKVINNTNYGVVTELQQAYLAAVAPLQQIITCCGAAQLQPGEGAQAEVSEETLTWQWFQVCEMAMHTLFHVAPSPDAVLANIVSYLYDTVAQSSAGPLDGPSDNAPLLARFLYTLGQGAMCTLVYTERMANIAKKVRDLNNAAASAAKPKEVGAMDMEAEMGMNAAMDAEHERNFVHMTEFELVVNDNNLLGKFHAFVAYIAANENGQFGSMLLRHTSTMALCRYMSISSTLCELYMPLLFTILESEDAPTNATEDVNCAGSLRTTIMICLGDLAFRFPNALEPWTNRMYARLSDADVNVRYNTLMVLTHLILNDMIKVKGQVVHVVLCISDKTQPIADLAKLLFNELSRRSNNPVYNLLGDIIAQLSATAGIVSGMKNIDADKEAETKDTATVATTAVGDAGAASVPEVSTASTDNVSELRVLTNSEFQDTMVFLLKFVNKDKQGDSLLERLLCRFATSISTRQNRHLSFCISQLPITEKGVKKMVDLFKNIKDALYDSEVFEHFQSALKNAKKANVASTTAKAQAAKAEAAAAAGADAEAVTSSEEAGAAMKSVSEEFQCLLDQIRAAATGVTGEGEAPSSSSSGTDVGGVSVDDADLMLFEASLGKKKPRPAAPGTAGKEKKKSRLSTSDDEGENPSGRPTRASKRNTGAAIAAAPRRPLRARQTNVQEEMEVEYSDGEAEVSF